MFHCSVINVLCCLPAFRYYHRQMILSTTFFVIFYHVCQRRRRDLNPRAAINDLHPFQGCPFGQLGYFSTARIIGLFNCVVKVNGEGGIRTHAPLRTNGFQDRLVMTTSIPLHDACCVSPAQRKKNDTIYFSFCQHYFSIFLFFRLNKCCCSHVS